MSAIKSQKIAHLFEAQLILLFAWRADSPPAPLPVHSFECTLGITLMALLSAFIEFSFRNP